MIKFIYLNKNFNYLDKNNENNQWITRTIPNDRIHINCTII